MWRACVICYLQYYGEKMKETHAIHHAKPVTDSKMWARSVTVYMGSYVCHSQFVLPDVIYDVESVAERNLCVSAEAFMHYWVFPEWLITKSAFHWGSKKLIMPKRKTSGYFYKWNTVSWRFYYDCCYLNIIFNAYSRVTFPKPLEKWKVGELKVLCIWIPKSIYIQLK